MGKAVIEGTSFGSITINGETFNHDVIIRSGGKVKKRKKKLSKKIYGTSHRVSLDEVEYIVGEDRPEILVVGSGQTGLLSLTEEAKRYLGERGIDFIELPTHEAIEKFNSLRKSGKTIAALIHVTC
ncbi:MAG: Mth938-like domain-containing protein [bacterium]